MPAQLDEAEKQILAALLADFSERGLAANDLKKKYEGPRVADLSAVICASGDISTVDFDLAFSDLEKREFIRTGPFAPYQDKPSSGFVMMGGYSKREYCSLSELGYKAARQPPNRPARTPSITNHLTISGGQFSNVQLAAGNNISQNLDISTDHEIVSQLIELLENNGHSVSAEQRINLVLAVEEAKDGNGKQAKNVLEKVCGPAWGAMQPIIWPIFGELLKKSLGI
ncbi:hypothetical protein [Pseudomonas sp. 5P_3.1_Bac2]|uniref:hypothetical protein n=1 Tax=Pseudomonas sp. 5P_3.1_Bac2 TaxID=2971617 RepID=UPI0021C8C0D0|nr:hypothetical protein [Pseudomonas sp. 5P_3.1_Bac2]MCU1717300.1 hypothetical protein [Pseudomonas sp. 5P_3.1_Bac2]